MANEIKELAKQTATATHNIKQQIEGVQQTAADSIKEINEISGVIISVNEIVATIASAVTEQSRTGQPKLSGGRFHGQRYCPGQQRFD